MTADVDGRTAARAAAAGARPRTVAAPGGPLVVFETNDVDRDLERAIAAGGPPPYGRVLWGSAPCVAAVLAGEPLRDLDVLELGCGVGLVSLVAARGGARVLATDTDEGALEATRLGAMTLGPAGARICVAHFDIVGAEPLPPAHIVVAADLLYEEPLARALARRVLEALARGGGCWWAIPGGAAARPSRRPSSKAE